MRSYRISIKGGRPIVEHLGSSGDGRDAEVKFDVPIPAGLTIRVLDAPSYGIEDLGHCRFSPSTLFDDGYAMHGEGLLVIAVTGLGGSAKPIPWFHLSWLRGELTLVDREATSATAETYRGITPTVRYFFHVTEADLTQESTRDPHVAAENLIQVSFGNKPSLPIDVCYRLGGGIRFNSYSQQRAIDTLTGLIAGYRFANARATPA